MFSGIRPFFCQMEAVETAIWITEVAPVQSQASESSTTCNVANKDANPGVACALP